MYSDDDIINQKESKNHKNINVVVFNISLLL